MTHTLAPRKIPASQLFLTDDFKRSDWIAALCGRVGAVWTVADVMPPGHFGTYFGATQRRTYQNPWIHDLYWLHELTHADTLTYDTARSSLDWQRNVIDSELEASLTSECYAYLRIPGLREKTFVHEIWIDRFIKGRKIQDHDIPALEEKIREKRIRAVNAPMINDLLEAQIHNYYAQNDAWCRIWSGPCEEPPNPQRAVFRVVEAHMSSPDRDATHEKWLTSRYRIGMSYYGPFLTQGLAFADVYKASNAKYGNWRLTL